METQVFGPLLVMQRGFGQYDSTEPDNDLGSPLITGTNSYNAIQIGVVS